MLNINFYQEIIFDFFCYVAIVLLFVSFFGLSINAPFVLHEIDFFLRIYVCLFLIWRFNPLRKQYEFTTLDRKIAFNAGLFIFTTAILTNLQMYSEQIMNFLENKIFS